MPLMNMRLAKPKVIVDVNRLEQHSYIALKPQGGMAVGALTRQRTLERSTIDKDWNPLLSAVMPYIGHTQIRNRGTFGGSIAHADPAAELPAVSVALEAEFALDRSGTHRMVKAQDFFLYSLTTAIEPDEMLTEVHIPHWGSQWAWGFQEVARRPGDFALAGAIALLQMDNNRICKAARLVLFGVGEVPLKMTTAEESLIGNTLDDKALRDAARLVSEDLDPPSDIHATGQYRKDVGGVVARRAMEDAMRMAPGDDQAGDDPPGDDQG